MTVQDLFKEKNKNLILLFLFVSLMLVCLPRFNRADYGFIKKFTGNEELYDGLPYDILIYKNYIEYFRGEKSESSISPPYTYRILIPYLSSLLPFTPLTSLNLINIFFLYAGLISLYLMLKKIQTKFSLTITGCILYVFSFPVFYYASSGYIDGSFVGILTMLVYFVLSKKYFIFLIIFFISVLANEKAIIILPFLISFIFAEKIELKKSLPLIAMSLCIYFMTTYLIRKLTPSDSVTYIWFPETKFLMQNIFRPKTYLSMLLTLGIPGIISIISLFRFSKEKLIKFSYFYIGYATSILLYVYSIFSAWSDGRTVWTSYPFTIPISVLYFSTIQKNK